MPALKWFQWVLPLLLVQGAVHAQDVNGFVQAVDMKASRLQQHISRQTAAYLDRLAREEKKLQAQVAKKDPAAADSLFAGAPERYQALQNKLKKGAAKAGTFQNDYIGHLDSLRTTLAFLDNSSLLKGSGRLEGAMSSLDGLQDKFNQTQAVNTWLGQRQAYLQEQLGRWGLAAKAAAWKKEAYYYRAQVEEYKRTFERMDRVEAKAMDLLSGTDAFKTFFSQHSEIGRLFQLPGSGSGQASAGAPGLQTIDMLARQMEQQAGKSMNPMGMAQQGIQTAAPQLDELKEKAGQLGGGGGSDAAMPDFKPNAQRTKSFLQRLEYGANVQSVKSNAFFPVTSDLAATLGYKLNEKSVVGIGMSYKLGWGRDIQHISLSSQGVGLRSFLDWKIKGGFWASGGAEFNYLSQFSKFQQLKDFTAWQKSALLGVMKKYKAGNKMTGNLQLLYDLLWQRQVPVGQPLLFRVGYSF